MRLKMFVFHKSAIITWLIGAVIFNYSRLGASVINISCKKHLWCSLNKSIWKSPFKVIKGWCWCLLSGLPAARVPITGYLRSLWASGQRAPEQVRPDLQDPAAGRPAGSKTRVERHLKSIGVLNALRTQRLLQSVNPYFIFVFSAQKSVQGVFDFSSTKTGKQRGNCSTTSDQAEQSAFQLLFIVYNAPRKGELLLSW